MPLLSGDARQAVFAPLDDGSHRSEAVVRRLGSAIALGLLEDGEQLPPESQLSSSLGVSTATLRDALADLRARGLLETQRGRSGGSFVRTAAGPLDDLIRRRVEQLGTTDLRELGELHAALAGVAALHAAARASSGEIARLDELVDRLDGTEDPRDRRRVDGRFYIELAASSQSVRLTRQELDLQAELGQLPWPPGHSPFLVAQTVASHRAVVAAVRARDGDGARSLAEQHVAARTRWLLELHLQLASPRREEIP